MDVGRTRWKRFGAVMLLSTAATAGLVALVANGAVAASFTVSGQQFKVSASHLHAEKFVQYGTLEKYHEPGAKENDRNYRTVAVSTMEDATLNNLCQSVYTDLGPLSVTLVIHAGDDRRNPVTAHNMIVEMEQLRGDATFNDIHIGEDAHYLPKWDGLGADETAADRRLEGAFGQSASSVDIDNLQQVAWATSAGTFNLKGLDLSLQPGKAECFPDPKK